MAAERQIKNAQNIMDDFATRTGIRKGTGEESRRYLWTDAFAVQAFFTLYNITKEEQYKRDAIRTIDLVHEHLGRFHPDDPRQGHLSGPEETAAEKHPTAGGLRIGKRLPERQKHDSYNSSLEWESDGQYFHYISRWIPALLRAEKETQEDQFTIWASELFIAAGRFIYEQNGELRMYWKMDSTLSRPLVPSMGAHDPLEGIICGKGIQEALKEENSEVDELVGKFEQMCNNKDWSTPDPLGMGALLLNMVNSAELANSGAKLGSAAAPQKLLNDSLLSLQNFDHSLSDQPAARRLAFRECGLSLGIKACLGKKEELVRSGLDPSEIGHYSQLANEIENFWLDPLNQNWGTWKEHLDINTVTLAASLIGDKFLG